MYVIRMVKSIEWLISVIKHIILNKTQRLSIFIVDLDRDSGARDLSKSSNSPDRTCGESRE